MRITNWSWEHNTLNQELCAVNCTYLDYMGVHETPPVAQNCAGAASQSWALECLISTKGTGSTLETRKLCSTGVLLKWLFNLTAQSHKKKLQITNLQPCHHCLSRTTTTSALLQHLFPHINRCSLTKPPVKLVWGSKQVITSTFYNERIKSSGYSP